jgi:hypothetical protein
MTLYKQGDPYWKEVARFDDEKEGELRELDYALSMSALYIQRSMNRIFWLVAGPFLLLTAMAMVFDFWLDGHSFKDWATSFAGVLSAASIGFFTGLTVRAMLEAGSFMKSGYRNFLNWLKGR